VAKRHPVGTQIDIRKVGKVLAGHTYGFNQAIVEKHRNDNVFDYSRPESSRIAMECRLLDSKLSPSKHIITVWVSVVVFWRDKTERDQLCELILDLQSEESKP
jgi:hypothetical protein